MYCPRPLAGLVAYSPDSAWTQRGRVVAKLPSLQTLDARQPTQGAQSEIPPFVRSPSVHEGNGCISHLRGTAIV